MLKLSVKRWSSLEAGCDEAGRGCLAGPVFCAAVILPDRFKNTLLNDSKKLSSKDRYLLRDIIQKEAIGYAVYEVPVEVIDKINILQASIIGMQKALDKLDKPFKHIDVDGNKFKPYNKIPHTCVIGGDALYMNIAAASILAKTYRDDLMLKMHNDFPQYGWNSNKGYATLLHRKALREHGPCEHHRTSFRLFYEEDQMKLNFEE